ncbi:PREDICTED: uncharacterized protein LOC108967652 isoform X2 [Bactrocera latifrons]|uniref:uncharacterized protein LOC108967652 isoform X2 n=1 Tax=Bactrocera latifrons TaxID=174628 RepID=UPI0008DC7E97|nr:PREDICTED: uncharacterized protein LOC108967652 isoform X2 [Bactrocera latifrons]
MLSQQLHAVIWLLNGVIALYAYPTINLPFLFGSSAYGENAYRFKKSGLEIQSDADVLELEHLKDHYGSENIEATVQLPSNFEQTFVSDVGVGKPVSAEPLSESQELERQLEQMPAITTKLEKSTTTELSVAPVEPETRGEQLSPVEGGGVHRPPTLQHDNGGKTPAEGVAANQQQTAEFGSVIPNGGGPPAPSAIKTVETLLKRHNGQLSAFDMAQYVFWTGDEAGVARAVEELIERGVMSRENALAFLREVRIGIEYLQQSYTNRIFPEAGLNINIDKKMFDMPQTKPVAPPTVAATNEKPLLPYLQLERLLHTSNQNQMKPVESVPVWPKLPVLSSDGTQDLNDYDENGERAKISQFLYNEYTLEDILYKLAKIMFSQSLTHGSDEAQHELQKLTDFLEREGNLGVIPIDLQKKVLHILFRALSDTLAERPELLSVANVNLANTYNRLPLRTLEP